MHLEVTPLALKAPCFIGKATGQIFLLQKKRHYLSTRNPTPPNRSVCLSVGPWGNTLKNLAVREVRMQGTESSYSVPAATMAISSTAYELVPRDRLLIKLVGHKAGGNPQLLIITHVTHM